MKKVIAAIVWVTVALAPPAFAQDKAACARSNLSQLIELSDKRSLQTPEARALLSGEALEWKMSTFGELSAQPDRYIFFPDAKNAVARVQLHGKDRMVDLYFYLTLEGPCKVTAVRTLSLTGIIEGAYQYLKTKPDLTEEEKNNLENYKLMLASDQELRAWFRKNLASMDELHKLSRGLRAGAEERNPNYAEIKARLKALHFASVQVDEDGTIEFIIGGVTDNTVGFLYSPTNKPPTISSNSYIWVEEVGLKWYLFRTT
jgi:hypothetical protein